MEIASGIEKDAERLVKLLKNGIRSFETKMTAGISDAEKIAPVVYAGLLDSLEVLAQILVDLGLRDAVVIDATITVVG